jgi:hypothetical protein
VNSILGSKIHHGHGVFLFYLKIKFARVGEQTRFFVHFLSLKPLRYSGSTMQMDLCKQKDKLYLLMRSLSTLIGVIGSQHESINYANGEAESGPTSNYPSKLFRQFSRSF